jgi:O-methyltransferase involved in polyketide biosynthesis
MKLEPTAAFVMKLAEPLFLSDALTRRYYRQLDISSAQELTEDYRQAGIYELAQELMCNRKFAVRHCLLRALDEETMAQVVILAAGKSPLGLEAATRKPEKIRHIFEVDVSSLAQKAELYHALAPATRGKVSFIEQDITGERLPDILREHGFDTGISTILVLEGITHYLPQAACFEILTRFASHHRRHRLIIEYGQPFDRLDDEVRPKAETAYGAIERRYHVQGMVKYTSQEIDRMLKQLGGELLEVLPLEAMEKLRTGVNRHFTRPGSGWLEVARGVF